jgi:lipoprotein Spr
MALMGTPYNRGGIDCSGFTAEIYGEVLGLVLPRSSQEQYHLGRSVERDDLRFGDLVFFSTTGEGPTHVGIFVGDGLFAHSSLGLGVTISILESEYYRRRYFGARRIVE